MVFLEVSLTKKARLDVQKKCLLDLQITYLSKKRNWGYLSNVLKNNLLT